MMKQLRMNTADERREGNNKSGYYSPETTERVLYFDQENENPFYFITKINYQKKKEKKIKIC